MPTVFAHPAVAVSLAPWFSRVGLSRATVLLGAVCTIIPDLDVAGLRIGIPYDSLLGHRGLSHSLPFAAVLAFVVTVVLARFQPIGRGIATFVFLFLCTASHGVLDAFTDGGHGVAFLSPFSNERYFFPWQPIAVSPLSISRFLSGQGWVVLASEAKWVLAPCLAVWGIGLIVSRRRA